AEAAHQARRGLAAVEAANQRKEQLESLVARANECVQRSELPQARELVEATLALDGRDARALLLRAELDRRVVEQQRQAAAAAKRRESNEQIAEASTLLAQGDWNGAAERLHRATEIDRDNEAVKKFQQTLQEAVQAASRAAAAERLRIEQEI